MDSEVDDVTNTHLHVAILMSNGRHVAVRRIDDVGGKFKMLDFSNDDVEDSESPLLVSTSREVYLVVRPKIQKTSSEILKILKDSEGVTSEIQRIQFPWPVKIEEAVAGHDFVIFRDFGGNSFSMGTGTRGELGVGLIRRIDEPVHIEHLAGIRIQKVVCGGWHTVALADGGDVYVWGWNRYRQLGKDKSATEMYPVLLDPSEEFDEGSPDDVIDDIMATENTTQIKIGHTHFLMGSDDVAINEFMIS
ncbi:hypothetical protein CRE_25825 [Caenorhabditis remanei]|uniref:Uncharacterized protein n=1 Tax=Caenorhabditis remanei TaxID=31234 RepID=E3NAA1_CAERE|nr:hypothetical protein CRE_25825 [Caenorhabditis remanei]